MITIYRVEELAAVRYAKAVHVISIKAVSSGLHKASFPQLQRKFFIDYIQLRPLTPLSCCYIHIHHENKASRAIAEIAKYTAFLFPPNPLNYSFNFPSRASEQTIASRIGKAGLASAPENLRKREREGRLLDRASRRAIPPLPLDSMRETRQTNLPPTTKLLASRQLCVYIYVFGL